jgi:hypothetical protein
LNFATDSSADPGCLFRIPDQDPKNLHSGSRIFIRIPYPIHTLKRGGGENRNYVFLLLVVSGASLNSQKDNKTRILKTWSQDPTKKCKIRDPKKKIHPESAKLTTDKMTYHDLAIE